MMDPRKVFITCLFIRNSHSRQQHFLMELSVQSSTIAYSYWTNGPRKRSFNFTRSEMETCVSGCHFGQHELEQL